MPLHYRFDFHPNLANLCERLRYSLGGIRPRQTTHQTLSSPQIHGVELDITNHKGGISYFDSFVADATNSKSPTYTEHTVHYINVKL